MTNTSTAQTGAEYPLTDQNIRYDFSRHRYILTADYVTNVLCIDIQARTQNSTNATAIINQLLNTASQHIYNEIMKYNNTRALEWIIAKSPSARDIVMDAMSNQLIYILSVGDLSRSAKPEERAIWLDVQAKNILDNREVEETGRVLTSSVPYGFCPPGYAEGGY